MGSCFTRPAVDPVYYSRTALDTWLRPEVFELQDPSRLGRVRPLFTATFKQHFRIRWSPQFRRVSDLIESFTIVYETPATVDRGPMGYESGYISAPSSREWPRSPHGVKSVGLAGIHRVKVQRGVIDGMRFDMQTLRRARCDTAKHPLRVRGSVTPRFPMKVNLSEEERTLNFSLIYQLSPRGQEALGTDARYCHCHSAGMTLNPKASRVEDAMTHLRTASMAEVKPWTIVLPPDAGHIANGSQYHWGWDEPTHKPAPEPALALERPRAPAANNAPPAYKSIESP